MRISTTASVVRVSSRFDDVVAWPSLDKVTVELWGVWLYFVLCLGVVRPGSLEPSVKR